MSEETCAAHGWGPASADRPGFLARSARESGPHVLVEKLIALKYSNRLVLGFGLIGQPNGFFVRVCGTQMRAEMNLFEDTLRLDRALPGPSPLTPLLNNSGA